MRPMHTSGTGQADRYKAHVCEECRKSGDTWVHLRLCLTCGHVGCCNPRRTSTQPSISGLLTTLWCDRIEPGESWIWCYVDEVMPAEIGPGGAIEQ